MNYLKDLKFPLIMSGLIFIISVLNLWRIDFYAVVLSVSYLVLGSLSNIGGRYFDLTGQRKATKLLLKFIVEPPGVFVLVLGLFYTLTGTFHWITIGGAVFLTLIVYAITYSDWDAERRKGEVKK
jgi:uncharacterized membrane protein